jgi:hypothetical protein
MRRISIALVCAAGAALLATSAWAKTVHYDGHMEAEKGGRVHFDVVKRNGRPRKVKNVTYDELKLHCPQDDSNTFVSSGFGTSAKVGHDGSFQMRQGGDKFSGVIGDSNHAHGKITVHFDHPFSGPCVNKHHDWSAKRA